MFTGIIEATGIVYSIQKESGNLRLIIKAPFTDELKEGQSIAHNGVCLTVEKIISSPPAPRRGDAPPFGGRGGFYQVTAIEETLNRTNLRSIKVGDIINLERFLRLGY